MNTETLATYVVKKTAIRKNGRIFPIGKPIELNEEDAARLKEFLEEPGEITSAAVTEEELNTVVTHFEKRILDFQEQLGKRDRSIEEFKDLLKDRNDSNANLNSALADKDLANKSLSTDLADALRKIVELEQQLAEAQKGKADHKEPAAKGGKK